ncbi:MAG: alkaline phosphatase family protein [Acidobacteriota bacterium]
MSRPTLVRSFAVGIVAAAAALLLACSTDSTEPADEGRATTPWIVIGIDGGEWRVIEDLWERGELPNLRRLADAGVRGPLKTAYAASPIIWTTIATGHRAEVHGITGFVVSTPQGEVPVSSGVRRVPALWNMTTRAGRRTAALGWWASWPAESIAGVVLSDRALHVDLDNRVSPASMLAGFEAIAADALSAPNGFRGNPASRDRDQVVTHVAERLASDLGRPGDDGFDLLLAYYRSVDIESHNAWKYVEPERFEVDPDDLAANRERVPDAYRAVDAAIGRILDRAPTSNVLVISDHGFHATPRGEEVQILIDMNRVLARLGWIERDGEGGLDLASAAIYSFGTSKNRRPKRLRFNLAGRDEHGFVEPDERDALRARLSDDLARLSWPDGSPLFVVRDASQREQNRGTDFEAFVLDRRVQSSDDPETRVLLDGEPIDDLVEQVGRISGTHDEHTDGIVIATGPDLEPAADPAGLSIFDITPTLLYGLGLPVAEDFAGTARVDLFTEAFRAGHPLRTIASWGTMDEPTDAERSSVDQELVDELRALGYIE